MFMISRKQLFGCGIALTMLGNVFCAVQAPETVDKQPVNTQVEKFVAQAKVALTATSNIPFKNIVTKNQQQYRLSDDAQANARTIAALPQPLLTMVANVFAAKWLRILFKNLIKNFLKKIIYGEYQFF
jgi:ABC-type proline/glycine betaine transport system ATPase subunit